MTPILRPVDVRDVRNLVYWLNEEYQATLGMIATTSKFTKNARDLVELRHRWRISLKDQATIIDWIKRTHQINGMKMDGLYPATFI